MTYVDVPPWISAGLRVRKAPAATSGPSSAKVKKQMSALMRITAAALLLATGSACATHGITSDDKESIKQIVVVESQSSAKIDSIGRMNPIAGAAAGFVAGIFGGAVVMLFPPPFGPGPVAVPALAAAGLWQGAACGIATSKMEIDNPSSVFKELYLRSVPPDSLRQAVEERLKILKPPDPASPSTADAALEILEVKIALGGSPGVCSPTLSGTVRWRLSPIVDNDKIDDNVTAVPRVTVLRRSTTANSFKNLFADESTLASDIQSFVNALGTAVADAAFQVKSWNNSTQNTKSKNDDDKMME